MKNKLRLTLNCLAGAAVTSLIYGLFVMATDSSGGGEELLGLAFLIVMPAALFAGSWVTGYMSAKLVSSFLGYLLISPGLYLAIPFIISNLLLATIEFALSMLLPGAIWVSISVIGVWYGVTIRNKKQNLTT